MQSPLGYKIFWKIPNDIPTNPQQLLLALQFCPHLSTEGDILRPSDTTYPFRKSTKVRWPN
jgi:hypothetical protein